MPQTVKNKASEISIYAVPPAAGPMDGYSYAGLKIVQALNRLGIKTPWRDAESPVSLSFCQPDWYAQHREQFRIGYTPWESTKVPEWWIEHINGVDMFWTTSQWCADVFRANGVDNEITVVPHGIDTNEWSLSERSQGFPFTFLHMGEPAFRKNGQMVFDAFVKVFEGNPGVRLIIKANGSCDIRNQEPFGPPTVQRNVTLITDKLSIAELNSLYQQSHCLVYPSNGEGFGMIPFQALATGMPTILLNWSGVTEFGEHAVGIKYTVADSEHGYHLGDWAFPDFDDLCDKMWTVYSKYEQFAKAAYMSAQTIRSTMTWDKVIGDAVAKLDAKL